MDLWSLNNIIFSKFKTNHWQIARMVSIRLYLYLYLSIYLSSAISFSIFISFCLFLSLSLSRSVPFCLFLSLYMSLVVYFCLILSHFVSFCLILSHFVSVCLILSHFVSFCLILPFCLFCLFCLFLSSPLDFRIILTTLFCCGVALSKALYASVTWDFVILNSLSPFDKNFISLCFITVWWNQRVAILIFVPRVKNYLV